MAVLLKEKELAEALNVTRPTVSKLRTDGKIPFYQYGGRYRYCLDAVKKALLVKGGEPTCKK